MFWNLLKKELKEQLTISSIIIMISLSFMYAIIGRSIGNIEKEVTKKPSIGIVNLDDGEFGILVADILKNVSNILYEGKDINDGIEITTKNKGVSLLVIPEDFTEKISKESQAEIKIYWILRGLGIMDSVSSGVVEGLINYIKSEISKVLMKNSGLKYPDLVLNPVIKHDVTFLKDKKLENISPNQLINSISSQSMMTSVIIMMLILMSGGSVISSMGLEKENKTLETLLTMPVKRSQIVFAKILSAAISGLIMALIYMVGFSFYMKSFSIATKSVVLESMKLGMDDYLLIGSLLFTAMLSGISISLLLGIFSKDFKSAQSMNFPLIALAIFSMLITMFKDFDTLPSILKIVTFVIPFTHPMLAIRALMTGSHGIILWSILYTTLFAISIIGVVSWLFKSDILIVGRAKINKTKRRKF
ncbi:MAG TPA: ABC transporter permease [Thermotogaceae bacterium]|nr:ABC transporter permease [Thermotogaceae bacterium]